MLWKRATLSIGAPIGERGGFPSPGQIKEVSENGASFIELIWVPFLDSDYIRSLSVGAVWN
jgi:hypothetical protein